jgi:cbb3-type cytochrome oxidase subunit 1
MPRLTTWAVRLAFSCLGVGFTLGALMLAAPGLALPTGVLRLRPLHLELLLVGWMVQLAFGVASWILPRQPGAGRSNESMGWAAIVLLNLGVLVAGIGSVLNATAPVLMVGRSAELLAAIGFAAYAWPRVRLYSR